MADLRSVLVFVSRGPRAGEFIDMTEDEATTAVDEGWGQRTLGYDDKHMREPRKDDDAGAKAFLDRRAGVYPTRELRPEQPGERRTLHRRKEPDEGPAK